MSKHPDYDDKDLIHDQGRIDPLGEIYSEMVSPDIDEMNDHAKTLNEESETESEQL